MTDALAYFATAPGGLEGLLADELTALGGQDVAVRHGGVAFHGDRTLGYRACLWSRLANRVLLPLAEFEAADGDALYAGARTVEWPRVLADGATIAVRLAGVRPAIGHTAYGAQRVKDAVVDVCREALGRRPDVSPERPDAQIHTVQNGERTLIALDLSGESLHRRGYRPGGVTAPLKENLAAAVLLRGEWPRIAAEGGALVDPLCGSGTLLVEGAWLAGDVAPGLLRDYWGFHGWRDHDAAAWVAVRDEAQARRDRGLRELPSIAGFDRDRDALRGAQATVRAAGLDGSIHLERRDLDRTPVVKAPPGLVATNPPYGERLQAAESLLPLYTRLGEVLRQRFPGWTAVVLNGAGLPLGLRPDRSWQMRNGPIECRLERFRMAPEAPTETAADAAADLANRLGKNQRRLAPWLKREGVTCYRAYDADIPEYALAVDRYETEEDGPWLHVQEYAPPRSVDPKAAARRLRQALAALPGALDVPLDQVAFKVRAPQKGRSQYQHQGSGGRFLTVAEGACRLRVNFTDYLDTGLFLDHRPVRQYIGAQAAGARVLNLFSYTGAATVHAVCGGASQTTSVDLSRTYREWAAANLALNGFEPGRAHRLVQADCREWLAGEGARERFDLILLDPPSFSNSRRMRGTLDIQRDQAALLQAAARLLSDDGLLIFSTNLRRFRLDETALDGLAVEPRTDWSIPPDFARNGRIHQCWFIRRRAARPGGG